MYDAPGISPFELFWMIVLTLSTMVAAINIAVMVNNRNERRKFWKAVANDPSPQNIQLLAQQYVKVTQPVKAAAEV